MATREELQAIAAQLAHPTGDSGRSIAKMMHESNVGMTLQAIQSLQLNGHEQLLELGHGNAAHLPHLLHHYPQIDYTGLETSACMHEEAKAINRCTMQAGSVRFFQYDGSNIPQALHSFDGIFSVNTIYFWKDAPLLLEKLAALLTTNGKIAITFADKDFMQQLPFTQYGFTLYTVDQVVGLANPTQLVHLSTREDLETVKNKIGEWVERKFFTVIWKKKFNIHENTI